MAFEELSENELRLEDLKDRLEEISKQKRMIDVLTGENADTSFLAI